MTLMGTKKLIDPSSLGLAAENDEAGGAYQSGGYFLC